MFEDLKIIWWPDPRLLKTSKPVTELEGTLRELAKRMLELMRAERGVGLAAPQVGKNLRMFVMNPTGKPDDDRVYVNPVLSDPEGEQESEEGCLSLPGVNIKVVRSNSITMMASDLEGKPIQQRETGHVARIWQHEFDHLNGILLLNRMGPVARMAHRKAIKDMEERYRDEHPELPPPPPARKKVKNRV